MAVALGSVPSSPLGQSWVYGEQNSFSWGLRGPLGPSGCHSALPKGLLSPKSLYLLSSPPANFPTCPLGLYLRTAPASLGVLRSGIPWGRDRGACAVAWDRTGHLRPRCPGLWQREVLHRTGDPSPCSLTLAQPWDLCDCGVGSKAFCSSLILASLYLCRFQFKMAFPGAFLNPNTNNSF